jgi:MFS family permease
MSDTTSVSGGLGRRRWLILGVIGLAQLMVILDLTVMNIALPSAQRALHFSSAGSAVTSNLATIVLMPRLGPRPLVASGMLIAAGAMVWLGPHTGYAIGVVGPLILAAVGMGLVIAPSISTGTFGVDRQDAGVASATVTVGQQVGASIGTSLLNTLFAGAVASYLATHLASARLIGRQAPTRQALTGLALAHGYDTAFWWMAGIFAAGAVIGGVLLRSGPLYPTGAPSQAAGAVTTAQAEAGPALPP